MVEGTHYEMLWDCPNCDTPGLLGLTHRHCPHCGAPQDETTRYFPSEEDKVAVADHRYVGADRRCPHCDSPNSAAAAYCTNCGGPLDDAEAVETQAERDADAPRPEPVSTPDPTPPPTPNRTPWGCLAALGALLVALCGGVLVYAFWTTDTALEVSGHQWSRTIDVQAFRTVEDDGWHDELPPGARDVQCRSKKRGTREVEDGQDCKTVNVDQGDGTFTQQERCTTRYRTVDVKDRFCDYRIDRWVHDRREEAEGVGLDPAPTWPRLSLRRCEGLGCEREATRRETYTVTFSSEQGPLSCSGSDLSRWQAFAPGSAWTGPVRLDGSLVCDGLEPAP